MNMAINDKAVDCPIKLTTVSVCVESLLHAGAPVRNGLGQATYTCVPLSLSSVIWYRPRGWFFSLGK